MPPDIPRRGQISPVTGTLGGTCIHLVGRLHPAQVAGGVPTGAAEEPAPCARSAQLPEGTDSSVNKRCARRTGSKGCQRCSQRLTDKSTSNQPVTPPNPCTGNHRHVNTVSSSTWPSKAQSMKITRESRRPQTPECNESKNIRCLIPTPAVSPLNGQAAQKPCSPR